MAVMIQQNKLIQVHAASERAGCKRGHVIVLWIVRTWCGTTYRAVLAVNVSMYPTTSRLVLHALISLIGNAARGAPSFDY